MSRRSQRSVSDQIPPEARRRAHRAGFSADDANWYAGRDYAPGIEGESRSDFPDSDDKLATARKKFQHERRSRRQKRAKESIRHLKSSVAGWGSTVSNMVAHFWASLRTVGSR